VADNDDRSGFERLSDRMENRADKMAGNLADSKHPGWKIFGVVALVIAILFGASILSGVLNFGAEAVHETKRVLSVKNIREQEEAIIQDWQNLLVAVGNACEVVEKKPTENSPTFVENPAMAYATKAREARTDYNFRQHSLFQAREVGPKGYPRTVPEDTSMDGPHPNWCAISQKLHETHE
jgi:Sec-independent protein translocase protein TatA